MGIPIGLDVLFVHPPRNYKYLSQNLKRRSSYIIFPMGLIGLADLIERNGYSAKILNYTLEKMLDSKFLLSKYLKSSNPSIVAVDLHWILHSAGAIETLQFVKRHFPNIFTLLGGLSATAYAKEILEKYDFIDGIIQGEAEVPIVELLKHRDSLDQVPNLLYRINGQIKGNKITYVAKELDSFNFAKVQLIEHWREYLDKCEKKMRNSFPLEIARGCPYNCIFCGGSRFSNQKLNGRNKVIFRSPRRVVDDIKEIIALAHIDVIHFGYGVFPGTEQYFMQIQKLIREEKIDISAELEVWRLPASHEFLHDFAATYRKKKSVICFSPRSFSSAYRQKFHSLFGRFDNSFNFSEDQFQAFMKTATETGLRVILFYDVGYPFETTLDIMRNLLMATKINLQNFAYKRRIALLTEPIIMSPGSPSELFDTQLGMNIFTKTFAQHVQLNLDTPANATPFDISVNYRTSAISSRGINFFIRLMWLNNMLSYFPFLLY